MEEIQKLRFQQALLKQELDLISQKIEYLERFERQEQKVNELLQENASKNAEILKEISEINEKLKPTSKGVEEVLKKLDDIDIGLKKILGV